MACQCSDCILIRELEWQLDKLKNYLNHISSDLGTDSGIVLPEQIKSIVEDKPTYPEDLHD